MAGGHPQHRTLFVPVAEHDAPAFAVADANGMHGRAVGVSMDQGGHAEAGEGGFHRLRIDVGDGLEAGRSPSIMSCCRLMLACRAWAAKAWRAASGWARNIACQCGSRVCARKAW